MSVQVYGRKVSCDNYILFAFCLPIHTLSLLLLALDTGGDTHAYYTGHAKPLCLVQRGKEHTYYTHEHTYNTKKEWKFNNVILMRKLKPTLLFLESNPILSPPLPSTLLFSLSLSLSLWVSTLAITPPPSSSRLCVLFCTHSMV